MYSLEYSITNYSIVSSQRMPRDDTVSLYQHSVATKTVMFKSGDDIPGRVVREIAKISALRLHPNLPQFLIVHCDGCSVSITVGDASITLQEYVLQEPQWIQQYDTCFKHLSQALFHMHRYGYVHGRICPQRVHVRLPQNVFVLGDLSDVLGPIGYLAPEDLTETSRGGYAADVWSLACVMLYYVTQRPVFDERLTKREDVIAAICDRSRIVYSRISTLIELLDNNITTSHAIAELKASTESSTSLSPRYISLQSLSKKSSWSYICAADVVSKKRAVKYAEVHETLPLLSAMLSFLPSQRPSIDVICAQLGSCTSPVSRRMLKHIAQDNVSDYAAMSVDFVAELCRTAEISERTEQRARDLFLAVQPVSYALSTALSCLLLAAKCSPDDILHLCDVCAYIASVSTDTTLADRMRDSIMQQQRWLLCEHNDLICSLV